MRIAKKVDLVAIVRKVNIGRVCATQRWLIKKVLCSL
jgi:hypothetical protein